MPLPRENEDFIRASLARYKHAGILPGSFLKAVIEGDLFDAYACADSVNHEHLADVVRIVIDELPDDMRGDYAKVIHHCQRCRQAAEREGGAGA